VMLCFSHCLSRLGNNLSADYADYADKKRVKKEKKKPPSADAVI